MSWSPEDNENPGVLEYQGRKYAVNLLWLITAEEEKKTLRRRRIKKSQADFYCLRNHISKQIGFGWLTRGHRRHMPVAATIVADQLVGEWHGVFQADNGWWYMQVHSDAIAPNGDRFFTAESDAYATFHENLTQYNWSHSYAPGHWNITEASREMTLARLLDDLPSVVLQSSNFDAAVGGPQNRNLLIIGIFTLILLAMATYALSSIWSQPEQVISAPRPTPIPTLAPPKKDTVELPLPSQILSQCREASMALFRPLPGWDLKSLNCSPTSLSVRWEYNERNSSFAQEGLKSIPTDGKVTISENSVTVRKDMPRLPMLEQEKLYSVAEGVVKLQQIFSSLGELDIKPITPPPPPPPPPPPQSNLLSGEKPPAPVRARPYLDVSFKTLENPDAMKRYLDLNGLQLISVVWDIPSGVWQYKMKVTLQRPSDSK